MFTKHRSSLSHRRLVILLTTVLLLLTPIMNASNVQANAQSKPASKAIPTSKPFPQHTQYTTGTIKPSTVTQAQMDQTVKKLYEDWKTQFLVQSPYKKDRYYVYYNRGGQSDSEHLNAVTVSEAMGYGMLATVFMAGSDPNAKTYFDGLYRFVLDYPSRNNKRLMAWQQVDSGKAIVTNPDNGSSSAIDGDMDIAYALLLADKQWGSSRGINYLAQAKLMINAIMKSEVHQKDFHLKLGDWVTDNDAVYGLSTRPSDFMLEHMKAFRAVSGDKRWEKVIDRTHKIMSTIMTNYSSKTGLLPDFVVKKGGTYQPASIGFLEANDGDYYYNSSRVPWRLATDYLLTGDKRTKHILDKMNNWIKTSAKTPGQIHAGYQLNGTKIPEVTWTDLVFQAPFALSAATDKSHQAWLNKNWDFVMNEESTYYFGSSVRLLSAITLSGNWWSPTH